ncbi:hypothetical protein SteCoe_10659 [Stentor coeruleus]|uniref:EF-hand domain-containing protein n=1 Tax=Stentor coeruleus TaxID=5963 RepID=A0A1R2CEY5_9CILI|nr:hypothetical protein SteCoe_10659 [Stentor coeruleus]
MSDISIYNSGILTYDEIEVIHAVFDLLDSDGVGFLTQSKLTVAIQAILKNSDISGLNIQNMFTSIDLDQDEKINWPDFLSFICIWLKNYNLIKPKLRTDLPISFSQKEKLYISIGGIITQNQYYISMSKTNIGNLESYAETWDYLGENIVFENEKKIEYYNEVCELVNDNNFKLITENLTSSDIERISFGLENIKTMLYILCIFTYEHERQGASIYLLQLFKQIHTRNLLNIIVTFLKSDDEIVYKSLQIITIISTGPRLPNHFKESYDYSICAKRILIETNVILNIIDLCKNENPNIKGQALLVIGFMTRYEENIRNLFIANEFLSILFEIINKGFLRQIDEEILAKATWVLSIFSGATISNNIQNLLLSASDYKVIIGMIFEMFHVFNETSILANGLVCLLYALPCLSVNDNSFQLQKLVQLISETSGNIRKYVLETVLYIVIKNTDLYNFLIEFGLFYKIQEVLMSDENEAKLEACTILKYIVYRGYSKYFLNITDLSLVLQKIIKNDNNARWEAIRVVKAFTQLDSEVITFNLGETGMIETLFSSLMFFRYATEATKNIYHPEAILFNYSFLQDILISLKNLILKGWVGGDLKSENTLKNSFNLNEAIALEKLIKILLTESKKGPEFKNIYYGDINLEKYLIEILDLFIIINEKTYRVEKIQIATLLSNSKSQIQNQNNPKQIPNNFYQQTNKNFTYNTFSALNMVEIFTVKIIGYFSYQIGMNQTIRKYTLKELEYAQIKGEICSMYGMNVKITYIDRQNDQFIIETQSDFNHVIKDSTTQAYNELAASHITRMGSNYQPVVIPEVHIKLIVSPLNNYGTMNNPIEINDIYTNFPNHKEIICRELNYTYAIPLNEIEFIYSEFNRVSIGRTANGLLNKTEFCLLMADKIKDQHIVECFFNAIDEKKSGFISIKRFVEALKVIRSNCTDDKIRLIFNAYSSTYGFMTQEDFSNMMLNNGVTVNFLEASFLSAKVFSSFNLNKDGNLVFTEFRNAYNMNAVQLSTTWDEIFYLKFAEVVVQCFQCAKKVYQRELRGQPPKCLECCKYIRSPFLSSLSQFK